MNTNEISAITIGLQNLNIGNFEEVYELTPLIVGLLNGTATVADVLQGNVNVVYNGMIPLMYAVRSDETELAQQIAGKSTQSLIYRNINDGKTALMYAIERNFDDMVEMLLVEDSSLGLNMVNLANDRDSGKTPLMYTLTLDNEACVNMIELLVSHGADTSARNEQNRNLYQEAQNIGNIDETTLSYINDVVYPNSMNPQGN